LTVTRIVPPSQPVAAPARQPPPRDPAVDRLQQPAVVAGGDGDAVAERGHRRQAALHARILDRPRPATVKRMVDDGAQPVAVGVPLAADRPSLGAVPDGDRAQLAPAALELHRPPAKRPRTVGVLAAAARVEDDAALLAPGVTADGPALGGVGEAHRREIGRHT